MSTSPKSKSKSKPKSKPTTEPKPTFFKSLEWPKDLKDYAFQITSLVWIGAYFILILNFHDPGPGYLSSLILVLIMLFVYIWPAILKTKGYTNRKTNPVLFWVSISIYIVTFFILVGVGWSNYKYEKSIPNENSMLE